MNITIKEDYTAMTAAALASYVEKLESSRVLGFATGNTPTLLYKRLGELCAAKRISFKGKHSFNLDEYYKIPASDSRSYRHFMDKNLFNNIDIDKKDIHFPDVMLPESNAVISYINEFSAFGPVDLQILGIGKNGHIAFNEPGSGVSSRIRIVNLAPETAARNNAPSVKAITMGISEILKSKAILLLASGRDKSEALYKAVKEKPNQTIPASFLQLHNDVCIIADSEAASLL